MEELRAKGSTSLKFIQQIQQLNDEYNARAADEQARIMLALARHIKSQLRDFALLVDAWHGRSDNEALEYAGQSLQLLTDFALLRHALPTDPRVSTVEGANRVELPADGVRCTACHRLLAFDVDGCMRCRACDRVYCPVTWLVLEAAPPTAPVVEAPVGADGTPLQGPLSFETTFSELDEELHSGPA